MTTAQELCADLPNTTAVSLDVNDSAALEKAVAEHDLVVSLIPYTYHADVIKAAIKGKTHVVTTSYVSPAMRELDAAAKEAGIVVMNEIGLDPGIDHLYAVKTIGEVHAKGGKARFVCFNFRLLHTDKLFTRSRSSSLTAAVSPHPSAPETRSATNSRGRRAACCSRC